MTKEELKDALRELVREPEVKKELGDVIVSALFGETPHETKPVLSAPLEVQVAVKDVLTNGYK